MDKMRIYSSARECPEEALKTILAGKLKGKSDINPMWRIKRLTELFGPCGQGWDTRDIQYWTTPGANGEVAAWCSLHLVWRMEDGAWSDPIHGIGGSMLVDTQRGALTTNDEAYKMAYTDAISVACKQLGFAADVYWSKDNTKYTVHTEEKHVCTRCGTAIKEVPKKDGTMWTPNEISAYSMRRFDTVLCPACMKEAIHG